MPTRAQLLTAREAAALLGVKPETLYAYVSRGLLESLPAGAAGSASGAGVKDGRGRRYRRVDVERLRRRPPARGRGSRPAAASDELASPGSALRWGEPVLETEVSALTAAGPAYRGQVAVDLTGRGVPFESVAELLWRGELPGEQPGWPGSELGLGAGVLDGLVPADAGVGGEPLAVLQALVALLGLRDPGRYAREPEAVQAAARILIRRLAAGLALSAAGGGAGSGALARVRQRARRLARRALAEPRVAGVLAVALGVPARRRTRAAAALDQALVLWADHELNVSSFASRVAASAGADLYACLGVGLAALSGPRHGGACDRIEALLEQALASDPRRVVRERLRRGELLPGFGQPLYPGGDPRAVPLLATATELVTPAGRPRLAALLSLSEAVAELDGRRPAVDLGTVALAVALGLRPGASTGIVAVGRAAGWVAHVMEQYAAGFMIRPRARFSSNASRRRAGPVLPSKMGEGRA